MSEQKVLYTLILIYTIHNYMYIQTNQLYAFRLVDLGGKSKFNALKKSHQYSFVVTWKITSKYSKHNFMHKYSFPNFERNVYIDSRFGVPVTVTS